MGYPSWKKKREASDAAGCGLVLVFSYLHTHLAHVFSFAKNNFIPEANEPLLQAEDENFSRFPRSCCMFVCDSIDGCCQLAVYLFFLK